MRLQLCRQRRLEIADQPHFGLQLDPCLLEHLPPGQRDQLDHVRRLGPSQVDDEIRVAIADLRAAEDGSLEPGLLDQAPSEVARRVDEHRTRVRQVERLGGAPAPSVSTTWSPPSSTSSAAKS